MPGLGEASYGQVIESYQYDNNPWVSIWDLHVGGQWAAMVSKDPPLKPGQLVTSCIATSDPFVQDVKPISKDELPVHLKPLIDPI